MKNERRARALLRLSPKNVQNCLFNLSGSRPVETDQLALFFSRTAGPPGRRKQGTATAQPERTDRQDDLNATAVQTEYRLATRLGPLAFCLI